MDHESAIERLHDLQRGRLDEPSRSELDSHLESCPECRSLSEVYRVLRSVLEEDRDLADEHPTSDEIVALAYDPKSIPEADREAIEAHLEQCRSCRTEVSKARQVEASLARGVETRQAMDRWRPGPLLAMAASILALALAYPAFVGLYRVPELRRSADLLRQETIRLEETIADLRASDAEATRELEHLRSWSGPAPVQLVTSARRREALATEIVLGEGRPFIVLGIDVGIPPELADTENLRFVILDPSGAVADEVGLAVGAARRQILSTAIITLLVPSSSLSPGPYEMRVSVPARQEMEPLLEVSLLVKNASS